MYLVKKLPLFGISTNIYEPFKSEGRWLALSSSPQADFHAVECLSTPCYLCARLCTSDCSKYGFSWWTRLHNLCPQFPCYKNKQYQLEERKRTKEHLPSLCYLFNLEPSKLKGCWSAHPRCARAVSQLVVERQYSRSVSCNVIARADCLVTGGVSGHCRVTFSSLVLFLSYIFYPWLSIRVSILPITVGCIYWIF